MVVLPLLAIGVTGWLLLLLRHDLSPRLRWHAEDLPTIFGVGAVLLHVEFLLASWGGAVALWHLGIVPTLLLVLLLWRLRKPGSPPSLSQPTMLPWPLWGGLAFLLGLQIISLLPILNLPLFDWEGRMLWALKARFLEESGGVLSEAFRDPYRLHIHPRYPLLVPWLTSVLARAASGFQELHYLGVVVTFSLLTTWQFYLTLNRYIGWRLALVLGLTLLLSSSWYTATINLQVEVVLAFFLLTAIARILTWLTEGRCEDLVWAAILLAGGAMTKNEGLLLALVVFFAVSIVTLKDQRSKLSSLGILPGIFIPLYLPWVFHQRLIPAVSDENYLQQFNLAALYNGVERLPLIVKSLIAQMTDWSLWHLFWLIVPIVVGWSLILWRKVATEERFVALVWVGYLCGILLIYMVSPWQDINLHIDASFNRVILPLFPCGLLLVGLRTFSCKNADISISRKGSL